MEKRFDTNEQIKASKVLEIVSDYKNKSNKDIELALEFISLEFDKTKENLLKLTDHLDKLEITYNTILKEYKKRNGR
jgi:hypothetical protein